MPLIFNLILLELENSCFIPFMNLLTLVNWVVFHPKHERFAE